MNGGDLTDSKTGQERLMDLFETMRRTKRDLAKSVDVLREKLTADPRDPEQQTRSGSR